MSALRTRRELLLFGVAGSACAVEGGVSALRPARHRAETTGEDAGSDASVTDATTADAVTPDSAEVFVSDAAPDLPPAVDASTSDAGGASPDHPDVAELDSAADAPSLVDVPKADSPSPTTDHLDASVDDTPDAAALDVTSADVGADCALEELYEGSLALSEVPLAGGVVDTVLSVVLARDARGLYAFSAVCPHRGCVVRIQRGASSICPCHDSTFNDDGEVTNGPAARPLLNHPVEVCQGRVYIDRSIGVPVGTRRRL